MSASIAGAIRLNGGVSAVSRRAGLSDGNVSKWLRGKPTLSPSKVSQLMATLGLVDGQPDRAVVHEWSLRTGFGDLRPGLEIYFPNGALVAAASWSVPGRERLKNLATMRLRPEMFVLTDLEVWAILRTPAGVLLPVDELSPFLRWREGTANRSVMPELEGWLETCPSVDALRLSWSKPETAVTDDDLAAVRQELGLSPADAIAILREGAAAYLAARKRPGV